MPPGENVEEKIEARQVEKPDGVRLWLSLVIVLLGVGLIVVGAAGLVSTLEVRLTLIVGGLLLVFGFGYVAVGGSDVKVEGSRDGGIQAGVELPQNTVRTTIYKRGFPKHGTMPPKHSPSRETDSGDS